MPKIEEIVLEGFRGATGTTQIALDVKKDLALFYGENGSGKSSLIDGLDVALTGNVGSLAEVSTGGTTKYKMLRSLGATIPTKVRVKVGGQWWESTLGTKGVVQQTPGQPISVHVLRRRQIQRLIEATDSEKYNVIEPCLGIAGAAKAEDVLAKALKDRRNSLDKAIERRDQAHKTLDALRTAAKSPMLDSVAWARRQTGGSPSAYLQEVTEIEEAERKWDDLEAAITEWHGAVRVAEAAADAAKAHAAETVPALGLSPEEAGSLVALLEASREHIRAHACVECPVCRNGVDRAVLLGSLDERLDKLEAAQTHRKESVRLKVDAEDLHKQATRLAQTVITRGQEMARRLEGMALRLIVPSPDLTPSLATIDNHEELDDVAGRIANALRAIDAKKHLLASRRDDLRQRGTNADLLATNLRVYDDTCAVTVQLQGLVTCLDATAQIVSGSRKGYVQSVLDELQNEVARMYTVVHPDEDVAAGTMQLDESKSGSLRHLVRLGIHADVPPAPYFSESHQDTLALCILLAVAKRQGGKESILLLDDVLMSVDNRHMDRVLTLLTEEMGNFGHVIMTTHVMRFFQKFRYAGAPAGLVELRHLRPQTQENGIQVADSPVETQLLRNALGAFPMDRQTVAAKAGVLMENVLDALVLNYGCSVAKKRDGENTLSELVNAFQKTGFKVTVETGESGKEGWASSGTTKELKPTYERFMKTLATRNDVGAHWKDLGQDASDVEVKEFAEASLALLDVLLCPKCHALPKTMKSDWWQCPCGRTRTNPVTRV